MSNLNRANKAIKLNRIDAIYDLLLRGGTRKSILAYAEKQCWKLSTRTIDKYIAEASKQFTIYDQERKERRKALHMSRLDDLYSHAFAEKDYKTCNAIIGQEIKLDGLDKETVEHTVHIDDMAELRRKLDAAITADPDSRDRITDALTEPDEPDDTE